MCFTVVKTYFFNLEPVGSWRICIIMVIGVHDSMIIIKNGGNAIYGATLGTPSLVSWSHLEKINLMLIAYFDANNTIYNFCKIFITNTSSQLFFHI